MKTTSTLYKALRLQTGAFYEAQVIQGIKTYDLDKLYEVKLYPKLFDSSGPQVGNTYSTQCDLTLIEFSANWPRMAKFEVRVRLKSADGLQVSEWLSMGTFYTDERSEDKYGNLSITAYDGMLLTEVYWTDKIAESMLPSSWPITCAAWARLVEGAGLITLDSRTVLDDTVKMIGLNTASTVRDVLKAIAAAHGGNWQMTPDGKLRLIPLVNLAWGKSAIAGLAIAGVAIVGTENRQYNADVAEMGLSVMSLEHSPALDAVTGVYLETESGATATAGDQTGESGYLLRGNCEFSSSNGVGALCLSHVNGYIYRPFEASGALLDPAAEVGDTVIIDDVGYQTMAIDWNLNTWPTADIRAPYEQEVDHEYQIVSPSAKTYRKTMAETDEKLKDYLLEEQFDSKIEQSADKIELVVSHSFVKVEEYNQQIQILQDQIDGNIDQWSGDVAPTLENAPANGWTTDAQKQAHIGDIYLVNEDSEAAEAGQYYRFATNGETYGWVLISDTALAEALRKAAEAQAAAEAAAEAAREAGDDAGDAIKKAEDAAAAALAATEAAKKALEDAEAYANQQLNNFINGDYQEVKNQLDGKIQTWYQAADPVASWDDAIACIAGIAVVGTESTTVHETAVVGVLEASAHTGDLWYRTMYNGQADQTTWRWNGTEWMQQDAPKAVFDEIDGKAQIFTVIPITPYRIGDLWFHPDTQEIMTCVVARESGVYQSSDWQKRNKYTDNSELETFVEKVYDPKIATIEGVLDGKVDTYFYGYEPSLTNLPASGWTTSELLEQHLDDLFYNTATGYAYRFTKSGTTYSWERIKDKDITEAMSAASAAQDTADGKRRVFVMQPTSANAYDVGDLWANARYPANTGATYNNDLLRCVTAKKAGDAFSIAHWQLATKYTDDSSLTVFINGAYKDAVADIQNQIDQKAETWYQAADPIATWAAKEANIEAAIAGSAVAGVDTVGVIGAEEHTGDLWYRTTDNTTWYWNGKEWKQQAVPGEVFDAIDGKAQIFVNTPAPPYNVGDLWFNSVSSDILTCMHARESGSFVSSDWQKRNKYTDDSGLREFVDVVYNPTIQGIEGTLDGKVDTYFYAYEPSLSNAPASNWTDTDVKDAHINDLFYNTSNGYVYRFVKNGSTYAWERVKDSDITSAMSKASEAKDTADGKRRVFTAQPTTAQAYDVGDLWANATYGTTYKNDLLRCKTAKASGTAFNISHWQLATRYTDNSELEDFLGGYTGTLQGYVAEQLDGKIETWYQDEDPSEEWATDSIRKDHIGDLWQTTDGGATTRRYTYDEESNTYSWIEYSGVPDSIYNVINKKAQIFITTPTAPYYIGDLWFQESTSALLTCVNDRISGFMSSDWESKTKYTDDTQAKTYYDEIRPEVTTLSTSLVIKEDCVEITNNGVDTDKLKLSSKKIEMIVEDVPVVKITPDEAEFPKKASIPNGGSLKIGKLSFIPRSTGNISVLWVDD